MEQCHCNVDLEPLAVVVARSVRQSSFAEVDTGQAVPLRIYFVDSWGNLQGPMLFVPLADYRIVHNSRILVPWLDVACRTEVRAPAFQLSVLQATQVLVFW